MLLDLLVEGIQSWNMTHHDDTLTCVGWFFCVSLDDMSKLHTGTNFDLLFAKIFDGFPEWCPLEHCTLFEGLRNAMGTTEHRDMELVLENEFFLVEPDLLR